MDQGAAALRCEVCGKPYHPGEEIRAAWVDGDLVVVHVRCARPRIDAVDAVVTTRQGTESAETPIASAGRDKVTG
jgi:hypothetical protein